MAEMGRTVIFISHKLHEVKAVADRVTVLRGGRAIATVAIDGRDAALARRADGRARARASGARDSKPRRGGGDVLETSGALRRRRSRRGGAEGRLARSRAPARSSPIAGVAGNGQRELAETIAGHSRADVGPRVASAGRALRAGDPRAAIAAGVAYVPEDRLGTGLAPSLSIASNLALKSYRGPAASRGPLLRLRAIRDRARRADPPLPDRRAGPGRAGAAALRRQPAEGRARARVLRRSRG